MLKKDKILEVQNNRVLSKFFFSYNSHLCLRVNLRVTTNKMYFNRYKEENSFTIENWVFLPKRGSDNSKTTGACSQFQDRLILQQPSMKKIGWFEIFCQHQGGIPHHAANIPNSCLINIQRYPIIPYILTREYFLQIHRHFETAPLTMLYSCWCHVTQLLRYIFFLLPFLDISLVLSWGKLIKRYNKWNWNYF